MWIMNRYVVIVHIFCGLFFRKLCGTETHAAGKVKFAVRMSPLIRRNRADHNDISSSIENSQSMVDDRKKDYSKRGRFKVDILHNSREEDCADP